MLTRQILAAIQRLSEQIERNHKQIMVKLDQIESEVITNQRMLLALTQGNVERCVHFFPTAWRTTYINPTTKLAERGYYLDPNTALQFSSYAELYAKKNSAFLKPCLDTGSSGILFHFSGEMSKQSAWDLFVPHSADYKPSDSASESVRAILSEALTEQGNLKSRKLVWINQSGDGKLLADSAIPYFSSPAATVKELDAKWGMVKTTQSKFLPIVDQEGRPNDISFLVTHYRSSIPDPIKVRRFTSYAVALQPVYDVYDFSDGTSDILPISMLLEPETNHNSHGEAVMRRAWSILTLTIAQEALYQGDLLLPALYELVKHGPDDPVTDYSDALVHLSDLTWLPSDEKKKKEEVAKLRKTVIDEIAKNPLLAYNLMLYGLHRDFEEQNVDDLLYDLNLDSSNRDPAMFYKYLSDWDFEYRHSLVDLDLEARVLRTAINRLDDKTFNIDSEILFERARELFRSGGPFEVYVPREQHEWLVRRIQTTDSRTLEAIRKASAFKDEDETKVGFTSYAKSIAQEKLIEGDKPAGWSVVVLGRRLPAPRSATIIEGRFAETSTMSDLLILRDRTINAIAGYELVDWAAAKDDFARVIKTPILSGTFLPN